MNGFVPQIKRMQFEEWCIYIIPIDKEGESSDTERDYKTYQVLGGLRLYQDWEEGRLSTSACHRGFWCLALLLVIWQVVEDASPEDTLNAM